MTIANRMKTYNIFIFNFMSNYKLSAKKYPKFKKKTWIWSKQHLNCYQAIGDYNYWLSNKSKVWNLILNIGPLIRPKHRLLTDIGAANKVICQILKWDWIYLTKFWYKVGIMNIPFLNIQKVQKLTRMTKRFYWDGGSFGESHNLLFLRNIFLKDLQIFTFGLRR